MSKFWFDMTEDILPNHMISVDVKDMPEFFQQPEFEGKSMMCKKLTMIPVCLLYTSQKHILKEIRRKTQHRPAAGARMLQLPGNWKDISLILGKWR